MGKKNNLEFEQIPGLVFKKNNQVVINPIRPLIENLDTIPFPARHLVPSKKYFDVFSRQKHFATIIATRGCPFNCIFCDRKNRMGKNWRVRSPKNIAQEIKETINQYGIREFMFFDDNLIVDKKWGLDLCKKLKPLNIIWECRNRVDLLDKEILETMKKSGC
ncbi:radical SAM protein, partial [Patescibacteria group bacterium]|nr:radical SAM protein [Patescibacteria group bacterium]